MARGGYQLLDFKGVNLTSGSKNTTLTEIYDKIEATNKRTVVTGLVVGGTEYDDMEVNFVVSSSNFVGIVVLPSSGAINFVIETTGVTVTVS